jgi:hypothetical protein
MSNHFPAVPSDLALASIQYIANMGQVNGAPSDLTFTGVSTTISNLSDSASSLLQATFMFVTPGDAGSFDQDSVESAISTVLDEVCQAVSNSNGKTLTETQAEVTVYREWLWTDMSFSLQYQDTMTYPAS